jgi:predicted TIM-barrel fold metal-dependent hydrolase
MASRRGLILLIHGDAEVIDAVFERAPDSTVLWAHLGTDPRPAALRPVLARHPRLYVDTSVRDERFVDDAGRLRPAWRRFFIDHADRVVVGVDTYWTRRWREFDDVAARIRAWLDQLPPPIADRIAHGNARRLFGLGGG